MSIRVNAPTAVCFKLALSHIQVQQLPHPSTPLQFALSSRSPTLAYKNRAICYVRVITPRIFHTRTCYHQRENADRRDSVECVKPVSGRPPEFLVVLFDCCMYTVDSNCRFWTEASSWWAHSPFTSPVQFLFFFFFLVISVYHAGALIRHLLSIKHAFQTWATSPTLGTFLSDARRLALRGVTGNKMI